MSKSSQLFENYLSQHFSHVGDATRFRHRKKALLEFNYMSLVPASRNARILEIGPGYGELLELLIQDHGYCNVGAIDISREVVEFCNVILPDTATLVETPIDFLVEHVNRYDCILMMHVLEHVPKADIIPLLNAIYQALAPGGKLIIEVPNMANPFTGLNIRYADFTHEVGFTELSMRYLLEKVGFADINVFERRLSPDHWSRLFQRAIQVCLQKIIGLVYRAYGMHRPKVISPALCVVAVR